MKWQILGDCRIRVSYLILSDFLKKFQSSCFRLSFFSDIKKIYYLRPRYEMANFRLFSYKGRLPKFFRLVLRRSIVLFTAKLIFKGLKKFIIHALDRKWPILGYFRIRVG